MCDFLSYHLVKTNKLDSRTFQFWGNFVVSKITYISCYTQVTPYIFCYFYIALYYIIYFDVDSDKKNDRIGNSLSLKLFPSCSKIVTSEPFFSFYSLETELSSFCSKGEKTCYTTTGFCFSQSLVAQLEDSFIRTQDDSMYVQGRGVRRVVFWNDVNGVPFILQSK